METKQIIGFCGRMRSGKYEFAHVCEEKFGYKRLYFALPLKQLICSLLSITIDELNAQKEANFEFVFHDKELLFVSSETKIPLEYVKQILSGTTFHNTRELMQIIGTDLIRTYNPNWHVERIREMIINDNENKFVLDDVRFPNECDMITELGGTLWFIVRPDYLNVSHHISEESLKWQDFDNIIVNNKPLDFLLFNWEIFLENDYNAMLERRQRYYRAIKSLSKDNFNTFIAEAKKANATSNAFNIFNALMMSTDELTYEKIDFSDKNITKEDLSQNGKCRSMMNNALNVEDLKQYLN